jgi:hypothetical protein
MKSGLHFVNFDVPGGVEASPATLSSAAKAAEQAARSGSPGTVSTDQG